MTQPNVLFFFVDNLGYGELGCYGGGVLRGADTKRIDAFAKQGMQLLNFAPESQCTPSRSALMTGRYSIRSGNQAVTWNMETGLVAWERTVADILSDAGYATALLGKWHIGASKGRWPIDHGFDEMYGPAHSYGEALWSTDPWYNEERDGVSYFYEGKKGDVEPAPAQQLTYDSKRNADREYLDRAKAFIESSVADDKPFFMHFNTTLMHLPVVPSDEYKNRSGNGDWADCLLQLDGNFGELLDHLDTLGVADNTIVIFMGDNGNEEQLLHRGTGGYWEGSYFTGMEASLRTPFLIRYPAVVPPGRTSNEIVHITDVFPTVLSWTGCAVPDDRVLDGKDQRAFFQGEQEESNREGFLFWNGKKFFGAKWKHFKLVTHIQKYLTSPALPLSVPHIINLLTDPKEREPFNHVYQHTWTTVHFARMVGEFLDSVETEPLIPMGATLDHNPYTSTPEEQREALVERLRSELNF